MMRKKRTKKNKLRDWIMKTKMIDLLYYVAMVFYEKKSYYCFSLNDFFPILRRRNLVYSTTEKKKRRKRKENPSFRL